MKYSRKRQIFIISLLVFLLLLLLAHLFSSNNSHHSERHDENNELVKTNNAVQEEEYAQDIDAEVPDVTFVSTMATTDASLVASNDIRIISFLNTIASNVNSDVIRLLKEWELNTVEYLAPPTGDPEHTLFLFLPAPDEVQNHQVDEIILRAFEDYGMNPEEIDAEVVRAVKGLTGWPSYNRLVMANADRNMEGSVVVFENVSDEMVSKIRDNDSGQYEEGFVVESSIMKLEMIDYVNTNRYSHLYELIP